MLASGPDRIAECMASSPTGGRFPRKVAVTLPIWDPGAHRCRGIPARSRSSPAFGDPPLAPGPVLDHSQNRTVAAKAIAERYVSGHLS